VRKLLLLAFILLTLLGCAPSSDPGSQAAKENWQVSENFTTNGVDMRGGPERLALMDQPILAGQHQQHTIYFWGSINEVTGKLTMLAVSEDGKSISLIPKTYIIPAAPLDGADNHVKSLFSIPTSGLWRLQVYIDDQVFGSIVINVKEDDA
jgi:hypothetical protein